MADYQHKLRFCRRGHDRLLPGGKRSNGQCSVCVREIDKRRNKMPHRVKARSERNWKDQGITDINGMPFTVVAFDRLYQTQQGRCALCNRHQSELSHKLSVDHDHKTGVVRGLLCDNCNKNLGIIENEEFKIKAMQYLKRDN